MPIWYPQYLPGGQRKPTDGSRAVVRPPDDLDRAEKHLQQEETGESVQDARVP